MIDLPWLEKATVPAWVKPTVLAILAAAALAFYFLSAPKRAREAKATADATEVIAESAQQAARETITHYDHYITEVERIDHRTEATNNDILRAPGASQRLAPELDRAGRIALCLHDDRDDAVCQLLLHGYDGGAEHPEPHPARPPAG